MSTLFIQSRTLACYIYCGCIFCTDIFQTAPSNWIKADDVEVEFHKKHVERTLYFPNKIQISDYNYNQCFKI